VTSDRYPWYEAVSGSELEQGDILLACPVFRIPASAVRVGAREAHITVENRNLIVLTQSCDLEVRAGGRASVDEAIFSPIHSKADLRDHPRFGKDHHWDEAAKGRLPAFHVLNRCELPGNELDFMLVDLSRVYSLDVVAAREFAASKASRVRLLPPYREHLGQAFARFFMRVGLPVPIPAFAR
jgi:hypothetical protein